MCLNRAVSVVVTGLPAQALKDHPCRCLTQPASQAHMPHLCKPLEVALVDSHTHPG